MRQGNCQGGVVNATKNLGLMLAGCAMAFLLGACGTSKPIQQGGEEFSIDADLYYKALKAQDNAQYFEAIHAWKELLDDEPRFAHGHYNLALMYDAVHMIGEAVMHYEKAAQLVDGVEDEKAAQARYNLHLGAAYLRQGYSREAQQALKITIRYDEFNAIAHYNMAGALMAQGNYDEGLLHADKAVDLAAVPDPNTESGLSMEVDRPLLASFMLRQAECHLVRKEWSKARVMLDRVKQQCKEEPPAAMWDRLNQGEAAASTPASSDE